MRRNEQGYNVVELLWWCMVSCAWLLTLILRNGAEAIAPPATKTGKFNHRLHTDSPHGTIFILHPSSITCIYIYCTADNYGGQCTCFTLTASLCRLGNDTAIWLTQTRLWKTVRSFHTHNYYASPRTLAWYTMHATNKVEWEKVWKSRREFEMHQTIQVRIILSASAVQEVGWALWIRSILQLARWLVMDLDSSLHRVSSAFGVLVDVVQP